jgi:superfamily II RNA helicase
MCDVYIVNTDTGYTFFVLGLCSADELLMTEMIFNGMFNNLTVPQCVALLSCFVCDEKSNEMQSVGEELSGPLRQMQVSGHSRMVLGQIIYRVHHSAKVEYRLPLNLM